MNTSKIKTYAIQARRDFIKAVTERANIYGIFSDDHIEPIEFKGDTAIIGERAFTKKEGELRERLVKKVKQNGFEMVMRFSAYTWFNRFVALRYMEIHDYLEHGYRVLSNNGNSVTPEILEHVVDVEFQGLDKKKVIDLKLAGTKDNELYRLLILAQCDDLHKSMPFLFDKIDNETELLLPDNLLHSDSPIRKMVTEIDESDWNDVEIIGWIYQFYISERKDEVIGKVVKSEDIPAATQLFTPNWIVKYMVQNTLGRMWLATYPDSPLKDKMEYYIEPAEQDQDVQKQLDLITSKELNPEEITFLDPACGSGHILVEAYDVFKEIYLERGYRTRDIPRLILEKNIFGLDICDRAAQLACFAVLMKARKDNQRILERNDLKLNMMAIQEAQPSDARNVELFFKGDEYKTIRNDLNEIVSLFKKGKTFGSLITVTDHLVKRFNHTEKTVGDKIGKWFLQSDVKNLLSLVNQIQLLTKKYDCVVTNPPYMGNKAYNQTLKNYVKSKFKKGSFDLYACFIERNISFAKRGGYISLITIPNWMFLGAFKDLRSFTINNYSIQSFVHVGRGAWGSDFGSCTFVLHNYFLEGYKGIFKKLFNTPGEVQSNEKLRINFFNQSKYPNHIKRQTILNAIPSIPLAYWVTDNTINIFRENPSLEDIGKPRSGITTGDNEKFLRYWFEVSSFNPNIHSVKYEDNIDDKWVPLNGGSDYRKWYGNNYYVILWENNGKAIKNHPGSTIANLDFQFKPGVTWTKITISKLSTRLTPHGYIFSAVGLKSFPNSNYIHYVCGFLNSKVVEYFKPIFSSTVSILSGDIAKLPLIISDNKKEIDKNVQIAVNIAKDDWNSFETSWDFKIIPILAPEIKSITAEQSFENWDLHSKQQIKKLHHIEYENNDFFIKAYGLEEELTPEIPHDQITLSHAERETDTKNLISYTIGCMMGRYSLNYLGLIYTHGGDIDFDPSKYKTFPADDDGIIPIMDQEWFPDDATNRFVEFLKVAWSPETLNQNLKFVADNLKPKRNETPIETIRRYLSTNYFKDHLKTYKKHPIYWLFSSGKQKAFECLVYLHRYNESTLSRMRSSYVTPLQGNFSSRLEFLQNEKDAGSTASAKNKLQKEIDQLKKKQAELSKFDDELRHYADMKISLDLDEGVKVNYGKFGNLLAEKKAITGEN